MPVLTQIGTSGIKDDAVTLPKIAGSGTRNNTTFLRGDGTFNTAGVSALGSLTDATINSSDPTTSSNLTPVGHLWINSTSGEAYVLTDATTNANVWTNIGDGTGLIQPSYTTNYLLVAGGGSGGSTGGGGAGGMIEASLTMNVGTTYQIDVGAGGAATTGSSNGANGTNSRIKVGGSDVVTAALGGGGGGTGNIVGSSGGSGGGAGADTVAQNGGAGTSGQGNAGGNSVANGGGTGFAGGGGGGKGAVGANGSGTNVAGAGGAGGTSTIITSANATTYSVGHVSGGSVYFAGGGGGGAYQLNSNGTKGAGGLGGGGAGGQNGQNCVAGTDYTGGGSGGQGLQSNGNPQGSRQTGGDGVVILKFSNASYSGTYTGSSVESFIQGSDRILIFKSSGTYTA